MSANSAVADSAISEPMGHEGFTLSDDHGDADRKRNGARHMQQALPFRKRTVAGASGVIVT